MKRYLGYLLLFIWMAFAFPFSLQAAKTKKFSKTYKNTRLEVVLNDICKRYDYQLVVDPNDIDMDKRITITFKKVSPGSALRKVLDKDLTYKIRKDKIFINRKPLPPEVYTSVAQTPSSIEENDSLKLTVWNDTVFSVTCRTVTKEVTSGSPAPKTTKKTAAKKSSKKSNKKSAKKSSSPDQETVPYKGHHILAGVGGAYADLGYSLHEEGNGRVGAAHGSFGATAQLQYAYFFHENWGIGAGVGFSHYTGCGTLNHTTRYPDMTDMDGERYTHLAITRNWKERQAAYMIDIPVEFLFHHPLNSDLGLYAGLGVKAGLVIASDYRLKSGGLEHQGEYAKWGLTLENMPNHGFITEQIGADYSTAKQPLALKLPAVGLMADFGLTIKMTEQINLTAGLFFNYTCNNIRPAETTDIDWLAKNYQGEIASQYVQAVRPWEIGVKIGIDWRHKEKPKAKPAQIEYTRVQLCDTTVTLKQRIDTVYKPKPAVAHAIVRLMEKSVIWYDLDSTEPKLKPADILDKIAAILVENPAQRILIHGHASKEGTALHNKRLSENRAKVIYDLLIKKGVRPEQMTAKGFGVDKSYQEGEHEISLDRRVEIIPVNE